MAVGQLQISRLTHCHRGQAPSHIGTVLGERSDSLGQFCQFGIIRPHVIVG